MKIKRHVVKALFARDRIVSALLFAVTQFLTPLAYAQSITINGPQGVSDILCKIAGYMFYILISLCSIMVLYAAFVYVTSGGETDKVGKAKMTITYAAVGVVVALLAKAFPYVIANIVGGTVKGC